MPDTHTFTTLGTDHGPSCGCGGTVYRYDIRQAVDDDGDVQVMVWCAGCHRTDYFVPRHGVDLADAAQVSADHRHSR